MASIRELDKLVRGNKWLDDEIYHIDQDWSDFENSYLYIDYADAFTKLNEHGCRETRYATYHIEPEKIAQKIIFLIKKYRTINEINSWGYQNQHAKLVSKTIKIKSLDQNRVLLEQFTKHLELSYDEVKYLAQRFKIV